MTTVRNPATNLDTEWRVHMIVVPAKLGCGRGVMYDPIGVPREGCASFSDDGYPSAESSNFGAGGEQEAARRAACVPAQRDPRADAHPEPDSSGAGNHAPTTRS